MIAVVAFVFFADTVFWHVLPFRSETAIIYGFQIFCLGSLFSLLSLGIALFALFKHGRSSRRLAMCLWAVGVLLPYAVVFFRQWSPSLLFSETLIYRSPHGPFTGSAWPLSFAIVMSLFLVLHILSRSSLWSIIFWVPLAVGSIFCIVAPSVTFFSLFSSESQGFEMFSIGMVVMPLLAMLVTGIPACFVVWRMRPRATLHRRHWIAAGLALPFCFFVILNSPRIFAFHLTIQTQTMDKVPISEATLQRMHGNGVISFGEPVRPNADGQFHVTLNLLESFTGIVRAPGYTDNRISFFPKASKGYWSYYESRLDKKSKQIPLINPGILVLELKPEKNSKSTSADEPPFRLFSTPQP
ncbi:MAG: hypothetical protein H0X66_04090 [Verrucomicrobia bacterium]|nr:hypothetical protein [Verrucomicrobiota bacterium]